MKTAGGVRNIAALAGVPASALNDPIAGKSDLRSSAMAKVARASQVSLDWIMYGQERPSVEPAGSLAVVWVPRYDVRAAAGAGALVADERVSEMVPFHEVLLRGLRSNVRDLALVEVGGDSMQPTLADGEPALIDRSVTRFLSDGIYLLRLHDELLVKRVQRGVDGSITFISDNPRYRAQTLTPDQLELLAVIGEVVWPRGR